jgi:phytoene synthase
MHVQSAWETTLLGWATMALETGTHPVHAVQPDARSMDAAYAACSRLTSHHSRTFFLASALLPADKRQAVRALYAFCRLTDDTVDAAGGSAQARRVALEKWRDESLEQHPVDGSDLSSMVARAWFDARVRYHVPVGYAQQLIDGVARDLIQPRYESFDDLAAYSYGVAATVGLMAMHIIGFAGQDALPYAVRLGVALQMTNILRDVGEDWRAGRLYLPSEELAAFNLSEDDIMHMAATGNIMQPWRSFMRFQIQRNRQLYDHGVPGIALLNRDGRFAIGAAADLYRAILNEIEANDYDVFTQRAHVSRIGKLRRLPAIWWRSRRNKPLNA